jgi:hypothetical protein
LCCDSDDKSKVKNDIEWLDSQRKELGKVVSSVKTWIDENLNAMRASSSY